MTSLRKTKPFTPDAQSTRFLYLILKQLDLKSINWQEVADNIGIKNGHAARMRWSRFKQHAEGTPPQPKTPKLKKTHAENNGKRDRENPHDLMKANDDRDEKRVKLEHSLPVLHGMPLYNGFHQPNYPLPMSMPVATPRPLPPMAKAEPSVKQEPGTGVSQKSGLPSGLTCEPPHWYPQHLPSTNAAAPYGFPSSLAPDEDIDDIPIKQLNGSHHATISMAKLQLSSHVKLEPGALIGGSPPQCTASGSPNTKHSDDDSQRLPSASALPSASTFHQPETLQTDASSTTPVGVKVRPSIATPPANFPQPNTMPAHAPTWFPTLHGAFQPTSQAYYPAFPPSYRLQQHPQHYHSQWEHQPPYPTSYLQRPIMHPLTHMYHHQHPAAPCFQDSLPVALFPVQNTHPSMSYATPRHASPSIQASLGSITSSQAPRDQVAQDVQGSNELDLKETPAIDSSKELQAEHTSTLQQQNDGQQPAKVDSTSLPEMPDTAQPEQKISVQADLGTANSEVQHPISCVSTTSIPALAQPAPAPTSPVEPSFLAISQTPAATQTQADPSVCPGIAAAALHSQGSRSPICTMVASYSASCLFLTTPCFPPTLTICSSSSDLEQHP